MVNELKADHKKQAKKQKREKQPVAVEEDDVDQEAEEESDF